MDAIKTINTDNAIYSLNSINSINTTTPIIFPTIKSYHNDIKTDANSTSNNHTLLITTPTADKVFAPIKLYNDDIDSNNPDSSEETEDILNSTKHEAEPFKNLNDIQRISDYFISKGKYRDNMLFIVGINFGLRASDLLKLKFKDIINPDGTFKYSFELIEQKTRNTRIHLKRRYIQINKAVQNAVILYLTHNPNTTLNDYLFTSQMPNLDYSRNKNNSTFNNTEKTRPMSRKQMERIIKDAAKELNIEGRFATHSLRKTFGYHMMLTHNNDPRFLSILQKIYGHSSSAITLTYIGITQDEIDNAYETLNLGLRETFLDSDIYES